MGSDGSNQRFGHGQGYQIRMHQMSISTRKGKVIKSKIGNNQQEAWFTHVKSLKVVQIVMKPNMIQMTAQRNFAWVESPFRACQMLGLGA